MNRPTDFAQRELALDIQQSWIVQAPAGSGKTGILVYRLLKLLAIAQKPEEVLAITFTKKAAKEMRDRLLELLQAANEQRSSTDDYEQQGLDLAKAVLANDAKHGWRLLDMPQQLNIETIDALCARLVSTMPWLSRLGDRPNTVENANPHFEYAIEQLLLELLDQDSDVFAELRELLLSLDNNFRKTRQLLKPMLACRDQWLRHFLGKDLQQSRAEFEDTWQTISEEILIKLSESVPQGVKETVVELAHFGAKNRLATEMEKSPRERLPKNLEFSSKVFLEEQRFPRADFADLDLWLGVRDFLITTSAKLRSPRGVTKTIGFLPKTAEKERFVDLLHSLENHPAFIEQLIYLENIPPATYSDEEWRKVLVLEKVLRRLLSHLQLRFHNSKECDFSEVALRANHALQDLGQPTDLALRMDYRIQHVLVDEFQDTSHSQFTLLENLTKGWQQGDGRTLFLVGDPMQSIYRFREADVGLFVKLAEGRGGLNEIELNSLVLSENFRSKKYLVDWFNTVFAPSFPADNNETNGAIKYSTASSHKDNGQMPTFAAFYSPEEEAEHIVSLVQQALARGDKKIAILVRSRSHLSPILPALNAAKISYQGVDIHPLASNQEVLDVIGLCKAIVRLDDKVAWLSLLRGPMVGLQLADITHLAAGQDVVVWEQLNNFNRLAKLSDQGQQRVRRFQQVMKSAMQQKHHVALAAVVQWAWQALGGPDCLETLGVDDMDVVWSLIREIEQGGDIEKIAELDQSLQGLFAQTAANDDGADQQVFVSTMHKSKGLQYDTVILPSLTRKGANQDKDILRWAEVVDKHGRDRLLLAALNSPSLSKEKNTHYHYLQTLEKQRDVNEQVRLLYVACTRAQSHLHLSGTFVHDKQGELKPKNQSNSLIQGIWGQIQDQFSLHDAADEGEVIEKIPDQTLKALPADYQTEFAANVSWQPQQMQKTTANQDNKNEQKFEWASQTAQATGIVLHIFLEHFSHEVLSTTIDDRLKANWRAELQAMQLDAQQINTSIKRLSVAVKNIQQDPKGQWIFADQLHQEVRNEFAITTLDDGKISQHRIDRTFIDQENTRWIIDYKSTTHFDDDVREFVDQQMIERGYKQQLERYAQAFSQLENRPIKMAIYFPLLQQWREWAY